MSISVKIWYNADDHKAETQKNMLGFGGLYFDVPGKFSNTEEPEGPNGLRHLATHISDLLMPNEVGVKASADQASVVEWFSMMTNYVIVESVCRNS